MNSFSHPFPTFPNLGRPGESEAEELAGRPLGSGREIVEAYPEQLRRAFRGVAEVGRLVGLAPVGHRREIRRVGLYHQAAHALRLGRSPDGVRVPVGQDARERPAPAPVRQLEDLGLALGKAVEYDAAPVDAARIDRLDALAERAPRMDHNRAAQSAGDRKLRLEGRPLEAERERGGPGILRKVEAVQTALAQGDGCGTRPALPEPRDPGDGRLPALVHRARVHADRVPDLIAPWISPATNSVINCPGATATGGYRYPIPTSVFTDALWPNAGICQEL